MFCSLNTTSEPPALSFYLGNAGEKYVQKARIRSGEEQDRSAFISYGTGGTGISDSMDLLCDDTRIVYANGMDV
ncbi:MAG: hypothetical protein ACE5EQ_09870, partial [Phycisphaerae bacterium]